MFQAEDKVRITEVGTFSICPTSYARTVLRGTPVSFATSATDNFSGCASLATRIFWFTVICVSFALQGLTKRIGQKQDETRTNAGSSFLIIGYDLVMDLPTGRPPVHPLGNIEPLIQGWLSLGMTNRQMAKMAGVTPRTMRRYRKAIREKAAGFDPPAGARLRLENGAGPAHMETGLGSHLTGGEA